MTEKKKNSRQYRIPGWFAMPFFLVLGVLTVVSFLMPLRPTVSLTEKRELAKFPEYSFRTLVSGSYFSDISLWFSDTFPGREKWMEVANATSALHGYSRVTIQGQLPTVEEVPEVPAPTKPQNMTFQEPAAEDTQPEVPATEEMEPEQEEWGGVNMAEAEVMLTQTAIQIGDAVYSAQSFSQAFSDRYAQALSRLATALKSMDCQVVSAPAPTAIGILLKEEDMKQLNCASQREILKYLHGSMGEDVLSVDTVSSLLAHNDEYIYFRTDHHWTALGAYYSYQAMCQEMDLEPVELETLEVWDQGTLRGSMYGHAARPTQLRPDNCVAYIPKGEITNEASKEDQFYWEIPLLSDHSNQDENTKYLVFGSDYPITHAHNASLTEGKTCLVIKDSFGNCMVPFLTQNFTDVYSVDYRQFHEKTVQELVEMHEVDYVIFMPYITAIQSQDGCKMFERLCRLS